MANETNEIVFDKKIIDDLLAEVNGELTAMLKSQKDDLAKAIQENSPDEQSEGSSPGMPLESLEDSSSSDSSSDSSDSSSSDSSSSDSSSSSSDSSDSSSSDSSSSDSSSSDSSSDSSSGSSDSGSSSDSSDSSSDSDSPSASEQMMMMDPNNDPVADNNDQGMDLKSEYMKLSPDQLKAHLEAAKAALMEMMGSDNDAQAQPKEEMKKDPMDMGKMQYSEESKEKEAEAKAKEDKNSKDEMMSKKEADAKISELQTQVKEQEAAFNKLTNLLLKPIRKSVTQENEVEDDVPSLSKNEVNEKLKEKLTTNLSKNDRSLVNQFYLGHVGLEKIKHLLS